MQPTTTLDRLSLGQTARVTALAHNPGMNRRFRDLGLTEGTKVQCLFKSPWGSPAAYKVRGAVIAIRAVDAAQILVVHAGVAL